MEWVDSAARAYFDPAVAGEALAPLVAVEAELAGAVVAAARFPVEGARGPAAWAVRRRSARIRRRPVLQVRPGLRRSHDRHAERSAPCAASRESAVACRSCCWSCPDRASRRPEFARFPDCR